MTIPALSRLPPLMTEQSPSPPVRSANRRGSSCSASLAGVTAGGTASDQGDAFGSAGGSGVIA
jgi:hypothetical protein